ncbi:uncharacterized protein LDX57_012842 [Neofusicoccum parvum]|nr:uncharacterized protein LDX57_012842 [Neofusicoccum parvum]
MTTVLPQPSEQHVLQSFGLKGKVAVVTGGSRGIGLAVSTALAEAGADIAIIYRSTATADSTAKAIATANNVRAAAYQCDVSSADAVDNVIASILQDFGRLDILVANAGVADEFPAEECTPQRLSETMHVNFDGAFWCAKAAANAWKERGHFGNIIFTTSMSAIVVNVPDKQAVYNASKAGLLHLARSLSIEWLGICRVNCISPGYIATEMLDTVPQETQNIWVDLTPAKRMGAPYELKGAYVFCASDASSFMTGGHIVIDGGYTIT